MMLSAVRTKPVLPRSGPAWPLFGLLALLEPALAAQSARGGAIAMHLASAAGSDVDPWGCLLRDLGSLEIPPGVLGKRGELDLAEVGIVRAHAERSAWLLHEAGMAEAASLARHHHERWDGTGYPSGLAGAEIPFPARALAVADVYTALTSARAYRLPRPPEDALAVVVAAAGTQLDPMLAELLAEIAPGLGDALLREPPAAREPSPRLERARDLSRSRLEALYGVALGLHPEEAAERFGRAPGTQRNWVSSLRRTLNLPARVPLSRYLAMLGRDTWDTLAG